MTSRSRRSNGEGNIRPLPSTNWNWRHTVGTTVDGRQLMESGTEPTRREAERVLRESITDFERGLTPSRNS